MTRATEIEQGLATPMASLPTAVDELAKVYPDHTWMKVPNDAELTTGWRDITYRELHQAANGLAWWIERNLGLGRRNVDVAAYVGVNDGVYGVAEIGLMKAGYKALLPSPRNSQDGQTSLFKSTKCNILVHSTGVESHIENIRAILPDLRILRIPSFDELLQKGTELGPFHDVRSENDTDQVLVLHTSGSTGLPKPIYHTHASIYTIAVSKDHHASGGRRNAHDAFLEADRLMISPAPFFHMMGQAILFRSIQCRSPIVILPPEKPAEAGLIMRVIEQTKPVVGVFPPSLLEQVAESPGGLEAIRSMKFVFYGGGPLATGVGDKVTNVTNLISIIGTTEAGLIPTWMPEDKHDWQYLEWSPGAGIVMESDTDSLFELVIKPANKRYQAAFHTFPDISEWRTKDLFERHPSKKNLWLYKGRKDDVLVLSNGEKFNPVGFEKSLEGHPLVKGALVVGQARFQTGLLIEPEWAYIMEGEDPAELLDQVWPLIEQANAGSPAHGRVWRSKIAIVKKDKPFQRTPKGSIIRRQTTLLCQAEIDALYSNEANDERIGHLSEDADLPATKDFLRKIFKVKGIDIPDGASDDHDIFSFGMDSLQVLALSSTVSHARGITISPRDIYSNPTISALAKHMQTSGAQNGASSSQPNRQQVMQEMVEKYTSDLKTVGAQQPKEPLQQHTYILTGSTGSLGNYILQDLLSKTDVCHVYCLNRTVDAEARQRRSFEERGAKLDSSKATFLKADFSKDRFGLDSDIYETLLRRVDIIIHNAWAVDFNKTLQTYEAVHVVGTRRCVDFSLRSRFRAHVVFISSIASVGQYPAQHPGENVVVPEQIFEDHLVSFPQGYGESKHVASLILARAADHARVPVTIIRAGQLAGPSGQGNEWNRHEWLPSIVISSKALGMVPQTLGNQDTVDWVPMDLAAQSVVDIADSRTRQTTPLAVAHLVNPHIVSWADLVPAVKGSLEQETGQQIKIVPFKEWLSKLAESPRTAEEAERKPGIKLIDFYEGLQAEGGGLPQLATEQAVNLSETVRTMKPVDAALMRRWLKQWQR